MNRILLILAACAPLFSLPVAAELPKTAAARSAALDFNRDVRPILADNCFECHGPDEKSRKAKLRLDTREGIFAPGRDEPVLVPGKPDDSDLIRRLVSTDPDEVMPPPKAHRRPTASR
jgi:hypothetical protein